MDNNPQSKTGLVIAQISPEQKDIHGEKIDNDSIITNLNDVENMFEANKPMLIEFYMNGCGPCMQMAPVWHTMIETAQRRLKNKNVAIVSIESNILGQIKNEKLKAIAKSVTGFPTMGAIVNKTFSPYNGKRLPNFLISFIKEKMNVTKGGGFSLRRRNKRTLRRSRNRSRSRRNKNTHRRRRY